MGRQTHQQQSHGAGWLAQCTEGCRCGWVPSAAAIRREGRDAALAVASVELLHPRLSLLQGKAWEVGAAVA